jgi:hypothetical protein
VRCTAFPRIGIRLHISTQVGTPTFTVPCHRKAGMGMRRNVAVETSMS